MTSLEDMPVDLLRAIQHAHRVLNWHENLVKDEVPPSWMWPYEDRLDTWFEAVEEERKNKYGGGGSSRDMDSDDMMSNEFAQGRGR